MLYIYYVDTKVLLERLVSARSFSLALLTYIYARLLLWHPGGVQLATTPDAFYMDEMLKKGTNTKYSTRTLI